jgi:predicted nucleic acid-binding protein
VLVLDSSAAVAALAGEAPNLELVERLAGATGLHAPHLIDLEVTNVLRRLVRRGEIDVPRAEAARKDYLDLPLIRYPHLGLLERIWELRDNFSACDAAFVALSEALEAPLITVDARLGRSVGHRAQIETF